MENDWQETVTVGQQRPEEQENVKLYYTTTVVKTSAGRISPSSYYPIRRLVTRDGLTTSSSLKTDACQD